MMLPILLSCAALLAAEVLDHEMTPQEKKKTGLYKLSLAEKKTLQNWIDKRYQKRPEPKTKSTQENHPTLIENLYNGHYIRLSDNSTWEIHPADVAITQGWITPVEIIATQSGDSSYPYKLTNSLTGSSVRARASRTTPKVVPSP